MPCLPKYKQCFPEYKPYPSAFNLISSPTSRILSSLRNNKPNLFTMLLGVAACSITEAVSPVTMLADIIIGIAEVSFAYHKGCSTTTLKSIAHKKLVASPLQHVVFIAINGIGIGFSACLLVAVYRFNFNILYFFSFVVSAGLILEAYDYGRKTIASFPEWAQPDEFNIIEENPYTSYFDKNQKQKQQKWEEEFRQEQQKWEEEFSKRFQETKEEFRQFEEEFRRKYQTGNSYTPLNSNEYIKVINELKLKEVKTKDGYTLTPYDQFKNGIIKNLKPTQLLDLKEDFTEGELKAAYKRFALVLHPDKNPNCLEESTGLIKFLFSICNNLQDQKSHKKS